MILFYVLAVVLIASAIFTISQKSPVYSVIGLLTNFITLAAFYVTLNAEFLGIIQIVVYSGAILMLFVFVIALLSSGIGPFSEGPNRLPRVLGPALATIFVAFGFLTYGVLHVPSGAVPAHTSTSTLGAVGNANVFGSVGDFGVSLFTTQLLPFEMTAFVLLVAVIGVVVIASDAVINPSKGTHAELGRRKRRTAKEREPIVKAGR